MSQREPGVGQRRRQGRRARPWSPLWSITLIAFAACGENGSTGDASGPAPTLAYVVARCSDDAGAFVFGPETLQIRRGDSDPVTVIEVPASAPLPIVGLCQGYAVGRHGPGSLSWLGALSRLAVSPDGSAVVFEVTDEFSLSTRNLSPEQKQIFVVRPDGSDLRALGPASRASQGGFQGFRFNPDGRRVVFNDKGPDHAGNQASQVVLLDITTGTRTQVTHLSPGPPGTPDRVCCPRFVDNETIAFKTTLNADGLHPEGRDFTFTVRADGTDLSAVPLPVVVPGGIIDPTFVIIGDQPVATILLLAGVAENPHEDFTVIREVFLLDGANLLQLTNFGRVDTGHVFLGADRQRVFFVASTNRLDTNPTGNCQLFSIDVSGANLRQLTNFSEGQPSPQGCAGASGFRRPLGCGVTRLFQDPVTQTVAFHSGCDPFGSNPNGVQVFSVQPDGTDLHQLTALRGFMTDADGVFSAEMLGPFSYPGQGSAFQD